MVLCCGDVVLLCCGVAVLCYCVVASYHRNARLRLARGRLSIALVPRNSENLQHVTPKTEHQLLQGLCSRVRIKVVCCGVSLMCLLYGVLVLRTQRRVP